MRDFRAGRPVSRCTLRWLLAAVWSWGLFPARGGSLMWPPEREHTQKLSNEEMVHNCLLAPSNWAEESHVRGIPDLPSLFSSRPWSYTDPVLPLQARDFPLQPPLIVSGRITALSSRYLGFPNSPTTSPLVKQPRVFVQVSSCIESFVLQGEPGAALSAWLW